MENLYTFSKHSWHVQFFKWMWGIDATVRYKTMCPYFWQFIGSLVILPLIIVWNLILWIIAPVEIWINDWSEKSAETEMQDILFRFRQANTMKEKYELWKSKCYRKYINGLLDMQTITEDDVAKFGTDAYRYQSELENKKAYEKAKRKVKIDNIKYGVIGKILLYTITAIILYCAVLLINWFVHLFTFTQFLEFLIILSGVLIAIVVILIIAYIIVTINDKYNCNNELTKFNPFIYIIMIFIGIWKGIIIIFDMIKNLYKESCPIITWKE